MWKVIMFVCAMNDPSSCVTIEDEWGPWATKSECAKRAVYMGQTALQHLPPSDLWWKCELEGDAA
jgi:hypothetical protein